MVSYISVNKLEKLEIGMTKAEVTGILGKHDRTPMFYDKDENGTIHETIAYLMDKGTYYFDFENDRLLRWYKHTNQPQPYPVPVPVPPANSTN